MSLLRASGFAALVAIVIAACDGGDPAMVSPPTASADASADGARDPFGDGGADDRVEHVSCATTFRYAPPPGRSVKEVRVTGEWNAFVNPGVEMVGPDASGVYSVSVELKPGLTAYNLVVDGRFELDPRERLRKYVGAVEFSAVRVADCKDAVLSLGSKTISRASEGKGRFEAVVKFAIPDQGRGIDPSSVKAELRKDGAKRSAALSVDAARARIAIDAPDLADGKYTILVTAADKNGRAAKPLRLVFWIEGESFVWEDALLYMAMIDRFKNGDPSNDPPKTSGVEARADFQGGDLQGLTQAIENGDLDRLGVRALWLSPFHTNPAGAYGADDGVHQVMGYHGYWPIKAREVDPRIGGAAALHGLVKAAHAHGIRVLQDFVVNHVHAEHEYFKAHPEWFRTGCVCGPSTCDWTEHRLDCLFAKYLPDVNWSVPAASEQFAEDAVWWIDEFDLDGLRVDAVKHVEDAAVFGMTARIRDEFEAAGTRVFLTGETAMGWKNGSLADNEGEYGTINRYMGSFGLDGQFDFVLHHAVVDSVFAYGDRGFLHADYWAQASGWMFTKGAIMTPYIGSHDSPRFVTRATYRGQDAAHGRGTAGKKWDDYAAGPNDGEPYARHRLALSWLMALPGAPLLYYGDEYGEWGGGDPNNRATWRGTASLSTEEQATLDHTRKLGAARRELVALRRGAYRPVYGTEDVLVFARQTAEGQVALVALSRLASPTTFTATLPLTLSLAEGALLRDRLGGSDVRVSGGTVTITLGSRGAAILAP